MQPHIHTLAQSLGKFMTNKKQYGEFVPLKIKAAGRFRFFSGKKRFIFDAKIKRRNETQIAHDPTNVPLSADFYVLSVASHKTNHYISSREANLFVLRTVV